MAGKFEVSEPTTKLCNPGSVRGRVTDRRAGGKSYQYYADDRTRKVIMIYEITGGDRESPNVRCIDQSSVARIRREVETAIAR